MIPVFARLLNWPLGKVASFGLISIIYSALSTTELNSLLIFCSFASALAGLTPNDIIQRTSGRLDTIHSEGVHVCR